MTNNFEEKKTLLYIANGLSNKSFVKKNIENIAEWIIEDGQKFCEHKLLDTKEEYNERDFMKFFNKNRKHGINNILGYASKIKAKYFVGETISIPEAVVEDDTAVTVNVYVMSPDGKFNFVNEGEKFRLTMKGNHTLCFLVYDVDYNITRVEIEFTVS